MSPLSVAYRYGITYQDYLDMDTRELEEAIIGVQRREAEWWRFLRIIAYGIMGWVGAFPKPISVEDWWPLVTDPKKEKVDHKKTRAHMQEVFRKRDAARKARLEAKKIENG